MDDFDDLLARGDALEDLLADALRLDAFDELARDFEMHVGGQKGGTHFFERLRHIFFREFADAAEIAEGGAEFFRERFKHEYPALQEFPARSNLARTEQPRVGVTGSEVRSLKEGWDG